MIRDMWKTTYNKKKSYADNRKRDLEFQIDDWVDLNISHIKGVMRSGKMGKHSPPYVGPYEILMMVEKVAYKLKLQCLLAPVHPMFHVYILIK